MIPSHELNEAVKAFEARFDSVEVPPPQASVQVEYLPTKKFDLPDITTVMIRFTVLTSGNDMNDKPVLFGSSAAAATAWKLNALAFLEQNPGQRLFWRTKPQMEHQVDFERQEAGYKVWSRLAIYSPPSTTT